MRSLVEALHRALASLFGDSALVQANAANVSRDEIDPRSRSAMAEIERLSNGSAMTDGEREAALEMRRKVAEKTGATKIERGEWNYDRSDDDDDDNDDDDEDDDELLFAVDSQGKQGSRLPPSEQKAFEFPPSVSRSGWVLKQGGGLLGMWRKRFYVLHDDCELIWFPSKEKAEAFFSDLTSDVEREQHSKRVDLISVVRAAEVGDGSRGHVVELASTSRAWRFAPLSTDDSGSFEALWNAFTGLVGLYNKSLARLSADIELEKPVDALRPERMSSNSRKALSLLEEIAYRSKTMTFADKRKAQALKQKILELAGDEAGTIARSIRQDGALSTLGGELSQANTVAAAAAKKAPATPPPMATVSQGWVTLATDESLAQPTRAYAALGTDGRIFFFDSKEDSTSFFCNPFSPDSAALLLDMLDLAAALTVAKTKDGKGIKLSTPTRKFTIIPEDASLLESMFQNILALIQAFQRTLRQLRRGNDQSDADAATPSSNAERAGIDSRTRAAMEQIERAGSGSELAEVERRAAIDLRRKVITGTGAVKAMGGEIGADDDDSDDEDVGALREDAEMEQAPSPLSFPASVSQSGWALKQGGGLLGMWRKR